VLLPPFISTEENSVLFVPQHRNQVTRRIGRFRLEEEPGLLRGPIDGGCRGEERTHKPLSSIVNLCRCDYPIPLHVERDSRTYGSDGRDGGIREAQITRESQPKGQRIGDVVVVKDLQASHLQASLAVVKVNFDGPVRHAHHPEDVVGINMRVEVVDLVGEYGRSSRTGIQVESNKGERPLVLMAVRTDKAALAEAHVRLVRQWRGLAGISVGSGAAAPNVGETNEPIEVCYLRRIVDAGQRHGGVERIVVNKDREGLERRQTSRDGIEQSTGRRLRVAVFTTGGSRLRAEEAGS
jgi:hypothetical protein